MWRALRCAVEAVCAGAQSFCRRLPAAALTTVLFRVDDGIAPRRAFPHTRAYVLSAATRLLLCRGALFDALLLQEVVSRAELQALASGGVPQSHRAMVWKMLLHYMPLKRAARDADVARQRATYRGFVVRSRLLHPHLSFVAATVRLCLSWIRLSTRPCRFPRERITMTAGQVSGRRWTAARLFAARWKPSSCSRWCAAVVVTLVQTMACLHHLL